MYVHGTNLEQPETTVKCLILKKQKRRRGWCSFKFPRYFINYVREKAKILAQYSFENFRVFDPAGKFLLDVLLVILSASTRSF